MPSDLTIAAIGLGFTAVSTIAGVLFPITRMMASHRRAMNDKIDGLRDTLNKRVEELTFTMAQHELDDERRFGEVRSDIDTAGDTIRREFGETAVAIREHVHQLELKHGEQRLDVEKTIQETRHTLYGRLDQQNEIMSERVDGIDERLRQVEIRRRN